MTQDPPVSIAIPSRKPPPLEPDHPPEPEITNTLALLLPHLSLFAPPILTLLKEHYAAYGPMAHWAPVKGFGRVIIVYEEDQDAMRAKKEGDWLKLDVNLPTQSPAEVVDRNEGESSGNGTAMDGDDGTQGVGVTVRESRVEERTYFSPRRKRRKSADPSKGLNAYSWSGAEQSSLVLRLHYLPPTPLSLDPTENLLKPPEHAKNFLISPPGSPPEGWEPITEDGPNTSTLADDLQRALERIQLNGKRRGSREVILDEGGVRVEVEDMDVQAEADGSSETGRAWDMDKGDVEEVVEDEGAWRLPSQGRRDSLGGSSGLGAAKAKIPHTARPPI